MYIAGQRSVQTESWTKRLVDKEVGGQRVKWTKRQVDIEPGGQSDTCSWTGRQLDREEGGQTGSQTERKLVRRKEDREESGQIGRVCSGPQSNLHPALSDRSSDCNNLPIAQRNTFSLNLTAVVTGTGWYSARVGTSTGVYMYIKVDKQNGWIPALVCANQFYFLVD